MRRVRTWHLKFGSVLLALTSILSAADPYRLVKTIPISGDYGWDYLTADTEGRRLYVAHDREVVCSTSTPRRF